MATQKMRLLCCAILSFGVIACGASEGHEGSAAKGDTQSSKTANEADATSATPAGKKRVSRPGGNYSPPSSDTPSQGDERSEGDSSNTIEIPISTTPSPSTDVANDASSCMGADDFTCQVEIGITRCTNALRTGQKALTYHARLASVARDWSRQQGEKGSISHDGFPSARSQVYVANFGGTDGVRMLAENVAMASLRSPTADDVAKKFCDMWANSAGHRRNMLGSYQLLGAGVWKSGNSYYATQIFGN